MIIAKVETFSSRRLKLKHYFCVRADNGEIVAQSEGYSRKVDRDATAAVFAHAFGVALVPREDS